MSGGAARPEDGHTSGRRAQTKNHNSCHHRRSPFARRKDRRKCSAVVESCSSALARKKHQTHIIEGCYYIYLNKRSEKITLAVCNNLFKARKKRIINWIIVLVFFFTCRNRSITILCIKYHLSHKI